MTTDTPVLSVGQQLRQAREQRGLSQQQVALQLNLKPEVVLKLEQDQLDGTLETYARGYVRAYARLMRLPEQELLTAYGQHAGGQLGSAKPMRTFSNRTAHQASENRFMWLTYGIIALLLLMLFIWWWQSELKLPVATAVSGEPQVVEVTELNTAELTAGQPEPTAEQLAAMLEQLTEADTVLPAAEPVAVAQLDQLEMRFSANCWVDVVDAGGSRVAYGTKQAGYIMQLSGKAPFVVTLGNPSVVQISLNQQVFDMSSFPGGRVAKFSIPESE